MTPLQLQTRTFCFFPSANSGRLTVQAAGAFSIENTLIVCSLFLWQVSSQKILDCLGLFPKWLTNPLFLGTPFLEIIWLIFHFRPLIMSIIGLHTNVHLFTILTFRFENRDPPPLPLRKIIPKIPRFAVGEGGIQALTFLDDWTLTKDLKVNGDPGQCLMQIKGLNLFWNPVYCSLLLLLLPAFVESSTEKNKQLTVL